MRVSLRSTLAVGAAILAAGVVTPAMAGDGLVDVLTVQLLGGQVEQIEYTGEVAPQVVFVPTSRMVAVPMMDVDPFATLGIDLGDDGSAGGGHAARGREYGGRHAPWIAARRRWFVCIHDVREWRLHEKRADYLQRRQRATADGAPAAQAIAVLIIASQCRPK